MIAVVWAAASMISAGAEPWWTPPPSASNHAILDETVVSAGKYSLVDEPALARTVLAVDKGGLTLESRASYTGPQLVRARVRLRTSAASPAASVMFRVARTARPETELGLYLAAANVSETIQCSASQGGKPLHDLEALTAKLNWRSPMESGFAYSLRTYTAIQPGWPEEYRTRIEHDMAELPDHNHKWLDVRIELKQGQVRFWVDDRLVAQKNDPSVVAEGSVRIALSEGVELADLRFAKLEPSSNQFLPVRLGGYANGRAFLGDAAISARSLPPADAIVGIDGVPFVFPGVNAEGNDHLAIGRSLFRSGNAVGYFPVTTPGVWTGAASRDPARIQVRIPNDRYDALYLVAASDGSPNSIPLVSAMFYRPQAGFPQTFEARVPLATANSREAKPLPVVLDKGKKLNLWLVKIPLDREKLTSFSDMDIVEVEFTKQVYLYRSYPDPIIYSFHQGGPPSGVHIYAVTFSRSPVVFDWEADRFGHVWTSPEVASYTATVTNRSAQTLAGTLTVSTRSYDGTEVTKQQAPVRAPAGGSVQSKFRLPVKLHGYHEVTATLDVGGQTWSEQRSFVQLAPDTRAAKWTEGKGALFKFWSYLGGHYTPKREEIERLMHLAGARSEPNTMGNPWFVTPQPWAIEEKPDPAKVAEFQKAIVKSVEDWEAKLPPDRRADDLYCFPEPGISPRLTSGNFPEYWNGAPYVYTDDETRNLKTYLETARIAAKTYRAAFPNRKILIPWGDPLFIVPLLRAGFPKELVDGSALDVPGFERIPERQLHEQSIHRLYELKKEFEKAGIPHPRLQFDEGIFVPTEPGAVSWREQMDIYQRWTLISMAYGVERFFSGWFAFDCGNYYGAEHYGGCGIQRRIPYCDPKPAYAAYATMTDKLDGANFDGWLPTGSLSTYCLRFKHESRGSIYALWTLRGNRPVTLELAADGKVWVTDSMNNTRELVTKDKKVTVMTDPSVVYVTFPSATAQVAAVRVGEPDHADGQPAKDAVPVADLGDGSWKFTHERNLTLENNHWAMIHYLGKFGQTIETDPQHGSVLISSLGPQATVHELMPWYDTLVPSKPIVLKGAPSAIGLWVKGGSDWGRVIYCLRDAKGERWMSIGTKDQYNCDDPHSWSQFCFDGWRYLRFELPGHTGYDSYRKNGTTWWRSDGGDGVVDLPLQLERLIIEQRSHILYVNDVQPVSSHTVSFGKMYVEYAAPEDATEEAVRISRLRMPPPQGAVKLPNPIQSLASTGAGAPTAITKLEPPLSQNDGTTVHVYFQETPEAKTYHIWCSAHADGSGAVDMTPAGAKNGALIRGLHPAVPFYFWVTYRDARSQMSKPSAAKEATLVDSFKEK